VSDGTTQVRLTVNGSPQEVTVEARKTLADVIREDLRLTGTHLGCEHGVCGACTILLDGEPVRSCLMLGVQAAGCEIVTVEGVATGGVMHPVQQAFWDSHSFQCGFCTPGFVITAYALLRDGSELSEDDVRAELSGNLCRCTGYQSIVEGVLTAAERLQQVGKE
jgi:carbon-monoxide dehydrogenase small subunit